MSYEKKYEIDENGPQHVIDEKNNSYILLAKYKWFGKGDYKLGLRKFFSTADGEGGGKGLEFLTEEGPNTLTHMLLHEGYGNADEIVDECVNNRKDIVGAFIYKINEMNECGDDLQEYLNVYDSCREDNDEDMYDPEDLLE